jgi:hypothetical protein
MKPMQELGRNLPPPLPQCVVRNSGGRHWIFNPLFWRNLCRIH